YRSMVMITIAITEFRAHMARFLEAVKAGEVVVLTSHGEAVAELRQPEQRRAIAAARLREIAAQASVGDVVSPVIDNYEL
ncbi:MAG: type II toxin-antitoxin system Phd/YefM family antitoxin, partial [Planctomycetota bacterium]